VARSSPSKNERAAFVPTLLDVPTAGQLTLELAPPESSNRARAEGGNLLTLAAALANVIYTAQLTRARRHLETRRDGDSR
jgi:hypothetical protein